MYEFLVTAIFMIQKRTMSLDFINIIKERGFVHQFTDEEGLRTLLADASKKPHSAYIGFDCTAPSLHVGSLLQIMLLRWWQKCGHRPIVLLGGGTTKIGDPSGKDESRKFMTHDVIQKNMSGLKNVFGQFLEFSSNANPSNAAIMVNNADWLDELGYVELLQTVGRHLPMSYMLSKDSVKLRLEREQNLSFLEFNYMVLQAYDFIELSKHHGCRVQMGGSDQWGNITCGIELNRRLGYQEIFGITSPLITTASGAKMGKTADGAIWLNEDRLSAYDYWQFWRNTEDGDVVRFLKLFTELSLQQIKEYESWLGSSRINEAKKILATEATALLHGREKAEAAAKTAADTFSGSGVSETLPEVIVPLLDIPVYEALVSAGFATSNSEARKLIKGNGVRINDAVVSEETARLSSSQLTNDGYIKLSAGKKRHALVKLKRG